MASKKVGSMWDSILEGAGYKGPVYWDKPFPGSIQGPLGYHWKYPHGREDSGAKRKALMVANPSLGPDIRAEVNLRHLAMAPVRTRQRKARVARNKANPYYKAIYGEGGKSTSPYYLYGDPESAADLTAAAAHRYRPELTPAQISQIREGALQNAGPSRMTPQQKQAIDQQRAARAARYQTAQRRHQRRQRWG